MVFIIIFIYSNFTYAQAVAQLPKVKEIGIGLYGFNDFSLQYRWGTTKKLYRMMGDIGVNSSNSKSNTEYSNLSDTNLDLGTQHSKTNIPLNLSLGFQFSVLNLKPINEKFAFFWGPTIGFTYLNNITKDESSNINKYQTYSTIIENKQKRFRPNIGLVLGVSYKISNQFYMYCEINPNFFIQYSDNHITTLYNILNPKQTPESYTKEFISSSFDYGVSSISNSNAMITFAYRIVK